MTAAATNAATGTNGGPRQPNPKGWPRISSAIFCEDAAAEIEWLCRAFGFEMRIRVDGEDGSIVHSELGYGDGLVMVSSARRFPHWASPRSIGSRNTQSMMFYVDDARAHCERARAQGAKITSEIKLSDYGEEYWADLSYEAEDPEGHRWWIAQRVRG
jgi:uncharacterized glyoxalase superfamily protein PhnB